MRQLIIQIPGHHNISSDLIARIVAEICTEASISIESALVNQWGDPVVEEIAEEKTAEKVSSVIDELLHKSIDIVNDVAGTNGIETVANILSVMQTGSFSSREKLKNAIVALTEYSKPSRLLQPPFRLNGYIFNSIKLLCDKQLI